MWHWSGPGGQASSPVSSKVSAADESVLSKLPQLCQQCYYMERPRCRPKVLVNHGQVAATSLGQPSFRASYRMKTRSSQKHAHSHTQTQHGSRYVSQSVCQPAYNQGASSFNQIIIGYQLSMIKNERQPGMRHILASHYAASLFCINLLTLSC